VLPSRPVKYVERANSNKKKKKKKKIIKKKKKIGSVLIVNRQIIIYIYILYITHKLQRYTKPYNIEHTNTTQDNQIISKLIQIMLKKL